MGVGTHLKYYIEEGGEYYDITPIRVTAAAGDTTFTATTGSSIITVTDVPSGGRVPTGSGAVAGDFVTVSGAVALGPKVAASVLNQEYQILSVVSETQFTILIGTTATSADTGNGGTSTVAGEEIAI